MSIYKTGEMERRVTALEARLTSCDICPRECRVNRREGERGVCHSARLPIISSFCAHHGEEPVLSGTRGSGTIFFGNCNLRCVYCQNHQISQNYVAQATREVATHTLAEHMLYLQNSLGCHNINLVSPSHFVPQIVRAVFEAVPKGLHLPLVYNTGGYDSLDTVKALDGIVDIYLPDLRYASNQWGKELSGVPDYVENARAAIKEMYRQVGDLKVDAEGVAVKGVIVRLLILPNRMSGTAESLRWLAQEVSPTVTVSVMSQYYPAHKAPRIPRLARQISSIEYTEVTGQLDRLGMEHGWLQGYESAANYLPDFNREGHPFEPASEPK